MLALKAPAPGLLEKARSRLKVVKLAVTWTDLTIKAAPYLDTLWEKIEQEFVG